MKKEVGTKPAQSVWAEMLPMIEKTNEEGINESMRGKLFENHVDFFALCASVVPNRN